MRRSEFAIPKPDAVLSPLPPPSRPPAVAAREEARPAPERKESGRAPFARIARPAAGRPVRFLGAPERRREASSPAPLPAVVRAARSPVFEAVRAGGTPSVPAEAPVPAVRSAAAERFPVPPPAAPPRGRDPFGEGPAARRSGLETVLRELAAALEGVAMMRGAMEKLAAGKRRRR